MVHPKKRRRAISNFEKKALRKYFAEDHDAQPSYDHLQEWFQDKFNHIPSKSTISEILKGEKYAQLDGAELVRPASKKERVAQWPDLEVALFDWQKRMEGKNAIVTGELIRSVAKSLWQRLPQYQDKEMPGFSNGWLHSYKQRHGLRQRTLHGEAGKVDLEKLYEELEVLRAKLLLHANSDIYNVDETGLYWKNSPNRTIASKQMAGGVVSRARITANLC